MEVITTTRAANTGSERAGFNNSGTIINHYPIYGKIRPDCKICFIYIGLQDYEKAEVVNRLNRHIAAVIMLPDTRPCQHIWNVSDLLCLIIESGEPPHELVEELATELLRAGAASVHSMPNVDHDADIATYSIVEKVWRIERPHLKTFLSREAAHV